MITSIFLLSLVGLAVSVYTYLLEEKIKKEPTYKPVCDLSDRISCSKPIKSNYGKLFFISNSLMGMLYYVVVGLLALVDAHTLLLILSSVALLLSGILAYILYFKIKSFCLLCNAIYLVNILIFVLSLWGR